VARASYPEHITPRLFCILTYTNSSPCQIYSAILQTCKQVASEGAAILYSKNIFAINLSREAVAPTQWIPRFQRNNFVSRIMDPKYLGSDGESQKRIPRYLSELTTVAFIQHIGIQNSATIEHVELFATRITHYNRALSVVTELLKQYMIHLRTANFWLTSSDGDNRAHDPKFYEQLYPHMFEESWIRLDAWEPLQDRLHNFCQEVKSMDVFKYNGTWKFCYDVGKPELDWKIVLDETDALTAMVEMRRSFKALNQFRDKKLGLHAKTREEIEQLFYRKDEKVHRCPEAINGQRLPNTRDWTLEEDKKGIIDGYKGDNCPFGSHDWHPSQLPPEHGAEEVEFDDEKDTLKGASVDWYSGGTLSGRDDEAVSSVY
jgi:hypothetical protein